jgi:diadenylate cyclase
LRHRLAQIYEALTTRDVVEIVILALAIYLLLRLLGRTRGAGMVRGLGLLVMCLFLIAQVIIASFDLTVLGRVLDYLLTTVLVGLLVIFQPELRHGLMVLGRSPFLRFLVRNPHHSIAEKLADTAVLLARERTGALIAVEREMSLGAYTATGEVLDAEVTVPLLRTVFSKNTPLHDGAVIVVGGRVAAAACQLPLGQPPEKGSRDMGMRHRAGLCLSEETDAVLLVVSEETGRISLAVAGRLEHVAPERLCDRLEGYLNDQSPHAADRKIAA